MSPEKEVVVLPEGSLGTINFIENLLKDDEDPPPVGCANVFEYIEGLPPKPRKEYIRRYIKDLATRIRIPYVSPSEYYAACFIMPAIYEMMDMDKNIHPMSYIDHNIHVMLYIDHNIHVAFYYGHRTLMTILQLEKIARCIN